MSRCLWSCLKKGGTNGRSAISVSYTHLAVDAARQMLDGRGWSVEGGGGRSEKVATGYTSAWAALSELESTHEVRVLPGYTVSGGAVTGKRIVIAERTGTFRGRIFEARLDATDIAITHSKRPITRCV